VRGCTLVVLTVAAACSPDVQGTPDAPVDGDGVDGPPFNTTHRGLVQALYTGTATVYSAGFYKVPVGAGCTWTFSGPCNLAVCENAGLEPVGAGTLTWTVGASTVVLGADAMLAYKVTSAPPITPMPPGTAATMASTGGQVDMFSTSALVMPQPPAVTAPVASAMVPRNAGLAVSWAATSSDVYITMGQGSGGAYPNSSARNLRCEVPGSSGQLTLPVELMSQFQPGSASFTLAAMAAEKKELDSYDVTIRAIATTGSLSVTMQ
jgi:hypothetical protein